MGKFIQKYGNSINLKNQLLQIEMVILVLLQDLPVNTNQKIILTGADQPKRYLSKLKGRNLALVL